MSTYTTARNRAEARDWPIPKPDSDMDTGWQAAWKRYWIAMADYEANGGGRPIAPHRSGGGLPPTSSPEIPDNSFVSGEPA